MDDLLRCQDAEEEGGQLADKLLPVRTRLSALQSRHFTGPGPGPSPGSDAISCPGASPSPSPGLGPNIDPAHPLLRLYQRVYLKHCSVQGRVWDLSAYALSQQVFRPY